MNTQPPRSEADQMFEAAFAIARLLAPHYPRPKRPAPEPQPISTFQHGVCDRCRIEVRRDGRVFRSVVGIVNGDPLACHSNTWWREIGPGVQPRHPLAAIAEIRRDDEWPDECTGCRCPFGMAPCLHCTDHTDEDGNVTSACDNLELAP